MAIDLLTPFTKVELKAKEDEKRRAIGLFWGNFNPVHVELKISPLYSFTMFSRR